MSGLFSLESWSTVWTHRESFLLGLGNTLQTAVCALALAFIIGAVLGLMSTSGSKLLRIIAPYPEVKICFDTNHLLSEDLLHFVEACGDRIATVHVSDYDMVDERHWLPGKGKIDWPALYGALMKAGYKGVFMYELKRGEGSFGEMVAIYEKLASDAAKLE